LQPPESQETGTYFGSWAVAIIVEPFEHFAQLPDFLRVSPARSVVSLTARAADHKLSCDSTTPKQCTTYSRRLRFGHSQSKSDLRYVIVKNICFLFYAKRMAGIVSYATGRVKSFRSRSRAEACFKMGTFSFTVLRCGDEARTRGREDARTRGREDARTRGREDARTRGREDARTRGRDVAMWR